MTKKSQQIYQQVTTVYIKAVIFGAHCTSSCKSIYDIWKKTNWEGSHTNLGQLDSALSVVYHVNSEFRSVGDICLYLIYAINTFSVPKK